MHFAYKKPQYVLTLSWLVDRSHEIVLTLDFAASLVSTAHLSAQHRNTMANNSTGGYESTNKLDQAPGTAMSKILDKPELLKTILLEWHPLDLLVSQRVNKKFQAVSKDSIEIQQKLFYKR